MKGKEDLSFFDRLVAGGLAGVAFWTAIYPLDAVKSRVQSYSVPVLLAFKSLKEEKALYRGLGPCLIRAFPATAAHFVAFEYSKEFILATVGK